MTIVTPIPTTHYPITIDCSDLAGDRSGDIEESNDGTTLIIRTECGEISIYTPNIMAINEVPNIYTLYSRICLAATMLAITGMYCYNYNLIIVAALLVSMCIIDSWRR